MLLYNENRSIVYEKEVTEEEVKALGGDLKSFWLATHRKDGKIVLHRKTSSEGW